MGVGNAAASRAIGKCEILQHGLDVGLRKIAGICPYDSMCSAYTITQDEAADVRAHLMRIFSPTTYQIRTDVLALAENLDGSSEGGILWSGVTLVLRAVPGGIPTGAEAAGGKRSPPKKSLINPKPL